MKTVLSALLLAVATAGAALAADLGKGSQNALADLEERVAELEATAAKKGNRKVSLTVYGEINAGIIWTDVPGYKDATIINNTNSTTKFGFMGASKVQGVGGGYQLEFGLKGTEFNSEIELRLANLWVETAIGKIALGRASQATDGITEISVANTTVASKMLGLKPTSSYFGFDNLPFNGTRLDLVRYETPSLGGAFISASYSADDWDVALKYAGELGGFRLAGGIGYAEHQGAAFWWLGDPQRKTISGSASIMHIASGIFLNGAYGKVDGDVMLYGTDPKAWQIQGGIENKVLEIGKTTAFVEYGELKAWGSDVNVWGIGLVQSIDAAAIDLYLNAKRYEGGGDDATVFITGARARF